MENLNDNKIPHVKNRRVVLGVVAIFFGVLILASNFDILSYNIRHILFSWQMILIIIGLIQIMNHKVKPVGYILIAVGGFFLLPDIFDFPFNFMSLFWPVLLIIVGLSLILFHRSGNYPWSAHSNHMGQDAYDSGYLDEVNIFGGSKRKIANQKFIGGKITNIFGGAEIDLTQAELGEGEQHVLEVVCVFGGMSLIVPSDWLIHVDVVSIFGAFEDKRTIIKKSDEAKSKIIIKGVAIFGGGDIKSY